MNPATLAMFLAELLADAPALVKAVEDVIRDLKGPAPTGPITPGVIADTQDLENALEAPAAPAK